MKKCIAATAAMLLVGCATTAPTTAEYDRDAESSFRAKLDQMFRDLSAMKFDCMRIPADVPEAVVFDFDEQNKPMSAYSPAEWNKIVDGYIAAAAQQGMKMETKVGRVEVHATSSFGFATAEFDQTFTMGDQKMGPLKFRGTMVAKRRGNEWVWVHWHGSFREFPTMPEAK